MTQGRSIAACGIAKAMYSQEQQRNGKDMHYKVKAMFSFAMLGKVLNCNG